jgi:tetratricopeptide (TPR) repeat protein
MILVVATTMVYFQSFFHKLIYLDDHLIVYERFEEINVMDKVKTAFTSNYLGGHYYRPVTLLSFVIDSEIDNKSLLVYHLSNYLIHLLTCLLLFVTLKNLGYSLSASFFASLFFSLTPIHINAVGWIAGRGDLLVALFSLSALFIFQRFIKINRFPYLLLVFTFLFLAFFSKETSLLVPFLLAVFLFIEKREFIPNKTSIAAFLLILITTGSYYILRGLLLTDVFIDKFSFTTFFRNLLVLQETVSKFFIPIGIKALPGVEVFTSLLGAVILLILLVLPLIFLSINKFRYYFGLVWFIALMLPGMVIRTMGQDGFFYWDCRSYLPSIGLILMLAEILRSIELSKYLQRIYSLAFTYTVILGITTFFMIKLYENPTSYWDSVKADYPVSYLPYLNMYNYYNHQGNLSGAEDQLLKAVKIRPEESNLREKLIKFYMRNDETEKAFNEVKEATLKESFSSGFYLEKFISLSIKTDQFYEIEKLTEKYFADDKTREKIKEIILKEAQKLEAITDTTRANKLLEKVISTLP